MSYCWKVDEIMIAYVNDMQIYTINQQKFSANKSSQVAKTTNIKHTKFFNRNKLQYIAILSALIFLIQTFKNEHISHEL